MNLIITYKKKFFIKRIEICSLLKNIILIIIIYFYIYIFLINNEEIPQFKFYEVKSFYPNANNFDLNYKKKNCRNIFKYKPNNEKDLVILAYEFQNKSLEHNLFMELSIEKVLNSYRNSIPFAHLICFVPKKSIKTKIVSILKKYEIEIIIIPNSKEHIANRRFIESYNYLKKNKHYYQRVLLIDLKDIFIFGDIFATIGENDLFVNYNCNKESQNLENCTKFFNSVNKKWFNQNINNYNTNKNEFNKFIDIKPITIIVGVFIGSIKNFFKFIEIFSHKLIEFNNKNQMDNFGYEQVLFNFLFYLGYFKKSNLKAIGCEQRMCFRPKNLLFNKKTTKFFYENSRCSPILIHKYFPNSWISK